MSNIKEFETSKGKFLAVENPKDAFKTGAKEFEIIGLANQLTEEKWADIVDNARNNIPPHQIVYREYTKLIGNVSSATESGQSLMQSIGCPIVNPLGKEPVKKCNLCEDTGEYYMRGCPNCNPSQEWFNPGGWVKRINEWQAAEKEIKNYLILKIKE